MKQLPGETLPDIIAKDEADRTVFVEIEISTADKKRERLKKIKKAEESGAGILFVFVERKAAEKAIDTGIGSVAYLSEGRLFVPSGSGWERAMDIASLFRPPNSSQRTSTSDR
jgi:hypothetical protein